jgi:serine/threonine-protein phosphatase PGAM5
MRTLQLPPEAWLRSSVYNASITVLEIRANGDVSLRGMGDVGHLPVEKITYN